MRTASKVALLAGIVMAGTANATVINVGNLFLDGFGASAGPFGGVAPAGVVSVTLTGFANPVGGFAWQNDMQMTVNGPGGSVSYGPNSSTPPGNILWNIADPGAPQNGGAPQVINVTLPIAGPAGAWDVTFSNAFPFNAPGDWLDWSNVQVTLNLVPAPASLALLGMGGLVAGRRRR